MSLVRILDLFLGWFGYSPAVLLNFTAPRWGYRVERALVETRCFIDTTAQRDNLCKTIIRGHAIRMQWVKRILIDVDSIPCMALRRLKIILPGPDCRDFDQNRGEFMMSGPEEFARQCKALGQKTL